MQLDGPAPNLLMVHHHLKQFEGFGNKTTREARKASKKAQEALAGRFERLDWVTTQLDELLKIAEVEGKEDEMAPSLSITHPIRSKLESLYKETEHDPLIFLKKLSWVYKDIRLVEKGVIPCFPADYDVYSHYVREYHKAVNSVVERIAETKLEGTAMLGLYGWTKYYKSKINKLGVPPELMEPPLLDGKEQELIERYLELIVQRLEEWTTNLMSQDVAPFITRHEPPEIDDEDGLYGTQGAITVMRGVQDQRSRVVAAEPTIMNRVVLRGTFAQAGTDASRLLRS
ncbi:exocyst complex component Sec6-domain-containing protein [Coprinopsis sp. MPI-PUGE-AT-0042]|nr:exocyst complex component Sec6-domain-containing protein [Coprinopsis sp. MPI-PUGE-AT-0042]